MFRLIVAFFALIAVAVAAPGYVQDHHHYAPVVAVKHVPVAVAPVYPVVKTVVPVAPVYHQSYVPVVKSYGAYASPYAHYYHG
ncbi:uncharacterized protein LOC132791984 [Drosophila nasuta]|uniref:uncharacterized protein LOC132791984 n=1 Tax=Drosophila nasuta TaxID=42062 RepID=UPI00295EFE0F|nr:uncharacterized protein LOC132791984 [Drosophila nasuta]XP_060657143.1 uncharacterized protein LOC132791984 [Drosophila nasuta]